MPPASAGRDIAAPVAPRAITTPPILAYGKRGAGSAIGPDETLVFVVDLIAVN